MHRAPSAMRMAPSGPVIFDINFECIQYCEDFGPPFAVVPFWTTAGFAHHLWSRGLNHGRSDTGCPRQGSSSQCSKSSAHNPTAMLHPDRK